MALDYQIDFNNGSVVIGDGTPYDIVGDAGIAGLEDWDSRNTDVTLPQGWGNIGGSQFVNPRVVTITVESVNPSDVLLLEAALTPAAMSAPSTLVPIRWKYPNREELVAFGRCARLSRARSLTTSLGLTRLTFQLEMPDPRAYAYNPSQVTAPVYVAGTSGLKLTLGTGADLGTTVRLASAADLGVKLTGVSGTGLVVCQNNGNVETYPVMYFTGPAGLSAWSVTNTTTGVVASFAGSISTSDVLVADMRAAAVASSTVIPISVGGVSRYGFWSQPRAILALQPGANTLRFDVTTGDPNASCLIVWQSAYLT